MEEIMARARLTRSVTETRTQERIEGEEHDLIEMSAQIAWETERDARRRQADFSRKYYRPLNAEFKGHNARRPSVQVAKFNRMIALLEKANPALPFLHSQDVIAFRVGEIVYRHRDRILNSAYVDRIRKGVAAAAEPDTLIKALKGLDAGHVGTLLFLAPKFTSFKKDNFKELLDVAVESASKLRQIGQVLSFATGEPTKPAGRPRIPYVFAVSELASLWEELTLSAPVYPRGIAKGLRGEDEAVQPSTQFIHLALQIIDQSITPKNVMSCLKRLLQMRPGYNKHKGKHIKGGYSWLRYAESRLNASAIAASRANSVRMNAKRKRAKARDVTTLGKQEPERPDGADAAADQSI
jgi:hypothetical protein